MHLNRPKATAVDAAEWDAECRRERERREAEQLRQAEEWRRWAWGYVRKCVRAADRATPRSDFPRDVSPAALKSEMLKFTRADDLVCAYSYACDFQLLYGSISAQRDLIQECRDDVARCKAACAAERAKWPDPGLWGPPADFDDAFVVVRSRLLAAEIALNDEIKKLGEMKRAREREIERHGGRHKRRWTGAARHEAER